MNVHENATGICSYHFACTSAKHHNTHPLSVTGWNTVYFDFEVLVVPFVSVCDLVA